MPTTPPTEQPSRAERRGAAELNELISLYYTTRSTHWLERVFSEIMKAMHGWAAGTFSIYSANRRDEVVQKASITLFELLRKRKFDTEQAPNGGTPDPYAYAFAVLRTTALQEWRGKAADRVCKPSAYDEPFLGLTFRADDYEIGHTVQAAEVLGGATQQVLLLPPQWREPVILQYYHGLTRRAGADVLGISETQFRDRLFNGMERLRKWAKAHGKTIEPEVYAALPQVDTKSLFRERLRDQIRQAQQANSNFNIRMVG